MKNKFEKAFKQFQTDKALLHEYHHHYLKILKDQQIDSVLEIGVKWGQSLNAWKKIWPKADIHGIDINVIDDEELNKNFKIYRMDSTNRNNSDLFTRSYDIIVDDGNHHWYSQLQTFRNFYRKASKYYIIEDIMGQFSVDRLYENIPPEIISQSFLLPSVARGTFTYSKNVEKDASFFILFIPKLDEIIT